MLRMESKCSKFRGWQKFMQAHQLIKKIITKNSSLFLSFATVIIPHPTSKNKPSSSESLSSISRLLSASNPWLHHYCGTSTSGWKLISFHWKYTDRSERGQLTVYPKTARLYGTAYAASRGSERYSSNFGWSARITKMNITKGSASLFCETIQITTKRGQVLHKK